MKKNKLLIVVVVCVVIGFILFSFLKNKTIIPSLGTDNSVELLFVGDIMLSRKIESIMYQEQDPLYYFLRLKDVTSAPDITFGNLETSVSLRGENVGSIYSFRSHPDFLKGPLFGGFDVLSIANNHTFDWGPLAFLDTIKHIKDNEMLPVGGGKNITEARTPVILERNGVTVAFLAYSQFANQNPLDDVVAIAPLKLSWMQEDIETAKKLADVIVISLHWGNEYEIHASEEQKYIAHKLIDAGALMVIGHHPHVIQEVERYQGGLIAYSLGNFVFDQNFSKETREGMMLSVTVKNNAISEYDPTIVRFTDRFQPYIPE